MNLFLLRHAIAVEPGALSGASDAARPLSPEGKEKMRKIARGMKALDLSFDLILSSPYVRARETAEIVAASSGPCWNSLRGSRWEGIRRRLLPKLPPEARGWRMCFWWDMSRN
jgi:phosphohistidine phosphatase SixA